MTEEIGICGCSGEGRYEARLFPRNLIRTFLIVKSTIPAVSLRS